MGKVSGSAGNLILINEVTDSVSIINTIAIWKPPAKIRSN